MIASQVPQLRRLSLPLPGFFELLYIHLICAKWAIVKRAVPCLARRRTAKIKYMREYIQRSFLRSIR